MSEKNISTAQKLTESALMVALAVVLNEFAKIEPAFLQGGGVTIFSQVPIILISYRHGVRQGLLTSFVFSLFEMMLGFANFGYVKGISSYLILIFFDYILAYGVLGLGGIFRDKIRSKQNAELVVGGIMVSLLRYACHIVSGATIWGEYCPEDTAVLVYSIGYNGSYMIPETVITIVGLLVVGSLLNFRTKTITPLRRGEKM